MPSQAFRTREQAPKPFEAAINAINSAFESAGLSDFAKAIIVKVGGKDAVGIKVFGLIRPDGGLIISPSSKPLRMPKASSDGNSVTVDLGDNFAGANVPRKVKITYHSPEDAQGREARFIQVEGHAGAGSKEYFPIKRQKETEDADPGNILRGMKIYRA